MTFISRPRYSYYVLNESSCEKIKFSLDAQNISSRYNISGSTMQYDSTLI